MEGRDTVDPDRGAARALDARSHLDEQIRQVHDLGLLGRVAHDRLAMGQAGRHHDVLGARHGDGVELDLGAAQPFGLRLDVAGLHPDRGPQLLQRLQVEVDRPGADGTAARQRDARASRAGDEGSQHQDRGPHGLDELVGRFDRRQLARGDLDRAPDLELDVGPEVAEHMAHGADVTHLGNVVEDDGLLGEQCGADVGQGRVLGSADADGAFQRTTAHDADLFHCFKSSAGRNGRVGPA